MYYLIGEFSNKIEYESYNHHNNIAISLIKIEKSNSKTVDLEKKNYQRQTFAKFLGSCQFQ